MDEGGRERENVAARIEIEKILPELPHDKLAISLSNRYFAIYDRENSEEGLNPITVNEILKMAENCQSIPGIS